MGMWRTGGDAPRIFIGVRLPNKSMKETRAHLYFLSQPASFNAMESIPEACTCSIEFSPHPCAEARGRLAMDSRVPELVPSMIGTRFAWEFDCAELDMTAVTPKGIERALMKLLEQRHPRSACPSEVARRIDADAWRALMPAVRDAAGRLAKRGRVDVLQRGKRVELSAAHGPVRLRLAAAVAAYRAVDFRTHPERYLVGRGEQGVLTAEPYKSELLPL